MEKVNIPRWIFLFLSDYLNAGLTSLCRAMFFVNLTIQAAPSKRRKEDGRTIFEKCPFAIGSEIWSMLVSLKTFPNHGFGKLELNDCVKQQLINRVKNNTVFFEERNKAQYVSFGPGSLVGRAEWVVERGRGPPSPLQLPPYSPLRNLVPRIQLCSCLNHKGRDWIWSMREML